MINSPQRLKDLIRNMAKRINGQPHILMRNYMMERFLERLAHSTYSDKFILKGGMLVASMIGLDIRATMDIDATIKGATLSIDSSRKIIEEITGVHLEDGIQFIIKDIAEIMDEADYPGIRVTLECQLDDIRVPLKVDISTGDVITPMEINYGFNLMLEDRKINVLAYNLETVLAEKLETVIARDISNTRMRDFYDIYMLLTMYEAVLNEEDFSAALTATARKRGSIELFTEGEDIFTDIEESSYMQTLWKNYQKKFAYASEIEWSSLMRAVRLLWSKYNH